MSSRLSPLDTSFWTLHTDTTPQVIASLCPLQGAPDHSALLRRFEEQLMHFPRFRQRVRRRFGYRWVNDPDFSLARHVRFEKLPHAETFDDLRERAEEIFSTPFDSAHPPWDFTVLQAANDEVSATLFRVHHAFADGLGAFEFFYRLCDHAGDQPLREKRGKRRSPAMTKPPHIFNVSLVKSFLRLLREGRHPKNRSAVNGPNSTERRFAWVDFSIADVKQLRRAFGGSLNDIMLAVVAGAIRRYHLLHSQTAETLKVLMPFSLRRRDAATSLGNHLTGVGVLLPVGTADPAERVERIKSFINRIKLDGSLGAYRMLGVINAYLPARLRRRISDAAARRANLICTNMPGPEHSVSIAGAKLLANYGCAALMLEQGIAFSFISYAGKMCVSLVADPKIVPDYEQLIACVSESFHELQEHAGDSRGATVAVA